MKKKVLVLLLLLGSNILLYAQVGIGTTNPDNSSILDVESTNKGVLVPRLTTAQRNAIVNPATSLLIFNTSTQQFEFNSNTPAAPLWTPLNTNATVSADANNIISSGTDNGAFLASTTYIGKFIITGTGSQTISGLPFQPSSIKFSAHANVETYNINADNGVGNNNSSFQNAFGSMQGYATNYGGTIHQQVIYIGGSGNSINDISRYASSARAIGIRYANQNGDNLGLTAAEVTSFNADGFTINVTNRTENIVVVFEAHR
ncbi:hypothetical protein [Jejuia pallidilutea]|uniref:Uncharacterized protein n=1 Tax=Jejuia pallidilutea TaxID=504487 RepID=A0A098LVA1_9FLAO|nr:hypothetical protein [Jejuia pallidilutea]GAL90841.1 hypothetical protein JCM19538_899 [Jejuia pallidilutea]